MPIDLPRHLEMLVNRVAKNRRRLRRWRRREAVCCYRLYDRDIPELPLAIDWYDGALHVAEYDRPHQRSPEAHQAWLEGLSAGLADALDVAPADTFLKRRAPQRGQTQYGRLSDRGAQRVVEEGGLRFQVNLSDYLDTGLFLDHRQTRALVRQEASRRHVLNLFGYSGAFSVYAAAGGAASTTTVDLSNTYLSWAATNLSLNGLTEGEAAGAGHRLVHADVRRFLERAATQRRRWDLIVLDPPTFSNSKSARRPLDLRRDHGPLLTAALRLLRPEGVLWFSTHARRFRLDPAALPPTTEIVERTADTLPPDFRDANVHRSWRLVRRAQPP